MPRDAAYFLDILDSAQLILRYVAGKSQEDFLGDTGLQDQVIRRFEIIGEAARHVSKNAKDRLPDVPWREMIGLRTILIHEYGEVNLSLLWATVQNDLPNLIRIIEPLVPPPPERGSGAH